MTEVDLINSFLARTDLTPAESILKTKAINLDAAVAAARKELEELNSTVSEKQDEVAAVTHQFQALLGLIVDIQTEKDSPAPAVGDTAAVVDEVGETNE